MKNALILHGTEGSSQENWFPWLKDELEKNGYKVWVPDLPGAEHPNIYKYNEFIFANKDFIFNDETIIIGHSSGAVAGMGVLQYLPVGIKIKKLIMVAGFLGNLDWDALDDLKDIDWNWQKIKESAGKIVLVHSDNDPYVPIEHGNKLKDILSAELIILVGQKHFSMSGDPNYNKFPELLEII